MFALHELAREAGINNLPRKYFVITAPATCVKCRNDLRFAERGVKIALQTPRSFNHTRDTTITRRK